MRLAKKEREILLNKNKRDGIGRVAVRNFNKLNTSSRRF